MEEHIVSSYKHIESNSETNMDYFEETETSLTKEQYEAEVERKKKEYLNNLKSVKREHLNPIKPDNN